MVNALPLGSRMSAKETKPALMSAKETELPLMLAKETSDLSALCSKIIIVSVGSCRRRYDVCFVVIWSVLSPSSAKAAARSASRS